MPDAPGASRAHVTFARSRAQLLRAEEPQFAGLVFAPAAALYNDRVPQPIANPDFSKVFIIVKGDGEEGVDQLFQTNVGLDEVSAGLSSNDTRLVDSVLEAVGIVRGAVSGGERPESSTRPLGTSS